MTPHSEAELSRVTDRKTPAIIGNNGLQSPDDRRQSCLVLIDQVKEVRFKASFKRDEASTRPGPAPVRSLLYKMAKLNVDGARLSTAIRNTAADRQTGFCREC